MDELKLKLAEMGLAKKKSIEEQSQYHSPTDELKALEQISDELMERKGSDVDVVDYEVFLACATVQGNMELEVW